MIKNIVAMEDAVTIEDVVAAAVSGGSFTKLFQPS